MRQAGTPDPRIYEIKSMNNEENMENLSSRRKNDLEIEAKPYSASRSDTDFDM